MFISSCHIIYTKPSTDYIFFADEEYPKGDQTYRNPDPRARPLACVDWSEVCTANGECAPADEEHPEYGKEYEFTREALLKSTIFKSIEFRGGRALLAQEKVTDFESSGLPDDQWIIESMSLFNTSLARIQFDALDIAFGAGHENDPGSYTLNTPDWARNQLCGIYKYRLPKGYTNIIILPEVALVVVIAGVCLLGWDTGKPFEGEQMAVFKVNWIILECLIVWLYPYCEILYRWFKNGFDFVILCLHQLKEFLIQTLQFAYKFLDMHINAVWQTQNTVPNTE